MVNYKGVHIATTQKPKKGLTDAHSDYMEGVKPLFGA